MPLQSASSENGSDTVSDDLDADSKHSGESSGILDKNGQYDSAECWDLPKSSAGSLTASLQHASHSAALQADSSAEPLQQEVPISADMGSPSCAVHWLGSARDSVEHHEPEGHKRKAREWDKQVGSGVLWLGAAESDVFERHFYLHMIS